MKKYTAEVLLCITAIIWGSGFVASAISLDYLTPFQVLAGRFSIGVIILCILFNRRLKNISKSVLINGTIIGVFLYVAFSLQTIGLQYTTPSKNAFLTAVNVVIVPFISFVLYKRKVEKFEFIGAIIAIIGIAVLSLQMSFGINIGDLLTLGCAFGFAFHIYYTAKFAKDEDPILLTLVQMVVASVLAWIVVILSGETNFSMQIEGISSILYLGIFSTTIAYLLQTIAQKYTTETKAAIILSTESFWGMLFSVIILSEVLTTRMIIGAILILCAIILSETKLNFIKQKNI